jgi:hypothetical protein
MKQLLVILFLVLVLSATAPIVTPVLAQSGGCPRAIAPTQVSISSATTTLIVAGQPGKHIYIWQFALENNHASTDVTVTLKDGTTALNGAGNLLKAGGGAYVHDCGGTAIPLTLGNDLNLTTSAAGTISGFIQVSIE